MARPRCRRCGGRLRDGSIYCPRCGTRQGSAPSWTRGAGHLLAGSAPGWFPDPFGRHAYRYWDGEIWTEHVYSGSYGKDVVSVDNLTVDRPPDGAWRGSFGSLTLSLAGLGVAFGLSFLFLLPFLLTGHPGGPLAGLVISEAGLWTGLFGTCLLTSRRYGTGKVRSDFRLRFRWVDLVIALGGAIVARCVAAIVLVPFLHELKAVGNPDKALYKITNVGALGWAVLVLFTCIGAPLFEELFFRGLLQGQLIERFGAGVGVAVTAVVFGAVHVANDPGVAGLLLALSVGACGIVLGVVRHLTGRLGSSMATHSLFNAIAVVSFAVSSALW
ncbi:MAG: CPBP family glutamic-type intramembrane protease [Acidimicrobiales bacterium]